MTWALPPPLQPDTFLLLRFLLTTTLLAFLPFLGAIIAGSTFSLVLNFFGRENRDPESARLSREWMDAVTLRGWILAILPLLPFPVFIFLTGRILGQASPITSSMWLVPYLALLSGCLLLFVYRKDLLEAGEPLRASASILAGIAGLLAMMGTAFLLFLLLGILTAPAKIPMAANRPVFFLSWSSFAGFLLFLGMSFGLAGGIALRFPGLDADKGNPSIAYCEKAWNVGTAAAMIGTLAVPALIVLFLVAFPVTGLSTEVFIMAATVPILALGVLVLLYLFPTRKGALQGDRVMALFILMFVAVVLCYQVGVANAFNGISAPPEQLAAQTVNKKPAAKPAAKPAGGAAADVEKGKKVFDAVCAVCHRFDARTVGPPLNTAVPKYKGDLAKLKAYIANPVKVDPDYPPMPPPGIKEDEVDAVAKYLLATVKGGK